MNRLQNLDRYKQTGKEDICEQSGKDRQLLIDWKKQIDINRLEKIDMNIQVKMNRYEYMRKDRQL